MVQKHIGILWPSFLEQALSTYGSEINASHAYLRMSLLFRLACLCQTPFPTSFPSILNPKLSARNRSTELHNCLEQHLLFCEECVKP